MDWGQSSGSEKKNCNHLRHSLRLNADMADTALKKKFNKILQILVAKPKLWKNLHFYKEYIFNVKIHFFFG